MPPSDYMYVFIRSDLPVAQQIVQAAHATFEVGTKLDDRPTPNFVLIGVDDEPSLHAIQTYLIDKGINCNMFFEPDINQHTALASQIVSGNQRRVFKKYDLYKP